MKKQKIASLILAFIIIMLCSLSTYAEISSASKNPMIEISSSEGKPGDEIELSVDISNNPGFCSARLALIYDPRLKLISAENCGLMDDYIFGRDLSSNPYYLTWDESTAKKNNTANGTLIKLKFKIAENAISSDLSVSISYIKGEIYNLNLQDIDFAIGAGKISVIAPPCEYGNANGDDAIDMKDIVLLRNYLAEFNYETGTSPVSVGAGADANGDGTIDMKDIVLLRNYLAEFNYETGTSPVILGPNE